MSQILPSQDELLAHAAAEPAFAAWLQGHGPLQHSAETQIGRASCRERV